MQKSPFSRREEGNGSEQTVGDVNVITVQSINDTRSTHQGKNLAFALKSVTEWKKNFVRFQTDKKVLTLLEFK